MRAGFSYYISLILVVFAAFGCNKKQQKVVINMDELRPESKRKYEIDPDTIQFPAFQIKDVSVSFRPIFDQIYIENRFYPSDAEIFPTRFGPTEYVAMTQRDESDAELASWYFMKFKDSIMTDNAWLNWLDCFGTDCQTLDWGSATSITERTGQIWTNDTLIVAYFSRMNAGVHSKETIKIDKYFDSNLRYSLRWEQGRSGSWKGVKFSGK